MINHGPMSHFDKDFVNMKINHGPMLHYDKVFLHMKVNHAQPWPTIAQHRIITKIVSI